MGDAAFQYEPLQARHIRVLKLDPSPHPSGFISCRCIHISLDDRSHRYVAVSYTWGSEEKPRQLLVNGRLLNITQTAHDIFQSKIMAEPTTLLWIDAVCINQEHLEEKALQVGFMREVFTNADSTRVWLGPSSQDSTLAFSFIETLFKILPEFERKEREKERITYYAMKYPEACPEWIALTHLLYRPWFTRTWVIQEVALSTRAEIVCGDDRLSWDTFEQVIDGLYDLGFSGMISTTPVKTTIVISGIPGLGKVVTLCEIRIRRKRGEHLPIWWLITRFIQSETTKRSDKLYGVLGLASDVADHVFSPDYTKSPEMLFTEVTRFLITRDCKLDMLQFAGEGDNPERSILPSWCFSYNPKKFRNSRLGIYPVTTLEKPDFWFSDGDTRLRLRGFIIDEVCQLGLISSVSDGHVLNDDETSNYYDWYCQAKEIFQSTEHAEEVFWRTMLANKLNEKNPPLGEPEKEPDQSWEEHYKLFDSIFSKISLEGSDLEEKQLMLSSDGAKAMEFRNQFLEATVTRRFCVLRKGSVGLMPRGARSRDLVVAFLGAPVLFVIRPLPTDEVGNEQYQLIGECYVHDRMNGQVMELGLEIQDIVLV